jgi:hypothetical protein
MIDGKGAILRGAWRASQQRCMESLTAEVVGLISEVGAEPLCPSHFKLCKWLLID